MSVDTILAELNALPIFKMSLGSKELFHSNDYVYVYEKITNEKIADLLDRMVDDIVKTKNFL